MRASLEDLINKIDWNSLEKGKVVFDENDTEASLMLEDALIRCIYLLKVSESLSHPVLLSKCWFPRVMDFCLAKEIITTLASVLENNVYTNNPKSEKIGIEFLLSKIDKTGKNSQITKKIRDILKENDFQEMKNIRHNMCHLFLEDKCEEIKYSKLKEMMNDVSSIFLILKFILGVSKKPYKSTRDFNIPKTTLDPAWDKYFGKIVQEFETMVREDIEFVVKDDKLE